MQINERPDLRDEVKQPYFYQGTQWNWGFSPSAEIWNGRLAMIGFLAATFIEIATGHGSEVLNPDIKLHTKSDQRPWE
ncbi:MAG: hypothetical protein KME35_04655 [Aphanocapsa sp. GSE-SYN-MK-11-07L]|jgi:hypothetical protein|nr:hypothetical protein [Aphanocapsa sp. GSE-SYN-MK-11-07L]